jgi:hypothetical protein
MKQTLSCIIFIFTCFVATAQAVQVGVYSGVSFFKKTIGQGFSENLTIWDNQPFIRGEYGRFALETSIGQFKQTYESSGNAEGGNPPYYQEYHYENHYSHRDIQWNIVLQYRFLRLKKIAWYAGASYTIFTEKVDIDYKDYYLSDPNTIYQAHSTNKFVFPYAGVNVRCAYVLRKHISASALLQYKYSGINWGISDSGPQVFFREIPNQYFTFQIGLSYVIN